MHIYPSFAQLFIQLSDLTEMLRGLETIWLSFTGNERETNQFL